jgi:magnesium transporter
MAHFGVVRRPSGALESYLSQSSNRINAVMKRLTVLATIGLPFTVISGYFGSVLFFFRRNDWL